MGLFSVSCSTGDYKSNSMTVCKTCTAGKEPNSAKSACGKTIVYNLKVGRAVQDNINCHQIPSCYYQDQWLFLDNPAQNYRMNVVSAF